MTVAASFSSGVLTVTSDSGSDIATISRNLAGTILVNGGAVAVSGGTPTVANTTLIIGLGGLGEDSFALDETNGPLPAANFSGDAGADSLTGGSNGDTLDGGTENDVLLGMGGADTLLGGDGIDILTGGTGNDTLSGGLGNDRIIWHQGDGSDVIDGDDGLDIVEINGGLGGETFTIGANVDRVLFQRTNSTPFSLDIGTSETLVLNTGGGDDQISATGNLAALIDLTIDAGEGNDTIVSGNGADVLLGGNGNDFIDGQQGNDVAFLGSGTDTFNWDPGDGSDVVEGQDGVDTLLFNASGASEIISISANGGRSMLLRDVGSIVMDLDDLEQIRVNALGGSDVITINDLAGTDLTAITVDLGAFGGGDDALLDQVVVNGSAAGDIVSVTRTAGNLQVSGLAATVIVEEAGAGDTLVLEGGSGADTATVNGGAGSDTFTIASNGVRVLVSRLDPGSFAVDIGTTENIVLNSGAGNDLISTTGNVAVLASLTIDAGGGNDTIFAGNGADVVLAGNGNDFVDGQQGNDLAFLGSGTDTFNWDPGDGSDVVEGQDDVDTLVFNGSGGSEIMSLSANGGRSLLLRDLGNIVMDLNDLEKIEVNAFGGNDTVTVNDLAGTDVTKVTVDLGAFGGGGDGFADAVIVNGSGGANNVSLTLVGVNIVVSGFAAGVIVEDGEAFDSINVFLGGGNDTFTAAALPAVLPSLNIHGEAGNDAITGSLNAELLTGGEGDDRLTGRAGNDSLFGQAGNDRFVWNQGDGSDFIEGGDDVDTLELNGGLGSETFSITANGLRAVVARLDPNPFTLDVGTTETLILKASDGNDLIDGSALAAGIIALDLRGGAGADTVLGNSEANRLEGNDGADLLNGGAGADRMEGGSGDDTFVVDNAADKAIETSGLGGDDLVESSVSFTLGNFIERLTLTGAAATTAIGNSLANILIGNAAANILDGKVGADSMAGGGGNDIYRVDNAGDVVTEGAGAGIDKVESKVSHSLDANVEKLTLTGTANINGTGNGLDNVINGNSGSNQLNGAAGADEMRGGFGNDSYIVDNIGDMVFEASAAGGTDTVNSSVTFALGANVENLNLTGIGNINGTGNGLANTINGNGGANILKGNNGNDVINGGAGADTIHGDGGNDDLTGGTGADEFWFDEALGALNVDDILDFNVAADTIVLDRTIFSGITANGTLAAAAFHSGTAAADADDRIIYDSATGEIFYDSDGTGGAAAVLFAHVDPGTLLTNADFFAGP